MKLSVDRVVQWRGWRILAPVAVCLVVATVLYIGWTVHQHNADLNCIKRGFNQVLDEALKHAHLRPPPDC